jgi:Uma2 family endonuclease
MEALEIEKALLRRPDALKITKRINKIIEGEKKERQHFYEIITEQEKAEFINGEIVYHSPVKIEHNIVCGLLFQLLNIYVIKNNLGFVGMEKILITLERNDYEPDIVFFTDKKSSHFNPGQMFFPCTGFSS